MRRGQTPSQTVGPFFAYAMTPEQYGYAYPGIAGPVLADSTGYALSRSGQLVRFEAANGSARVIAAVGETVISSPSVARNGVLFGTLQGTLYFFGRNGEPIWDVQLGGSIQAPAILYEGRIVVPMYGRVAGSFGSNPARGKVMELR